MARIAAASSVLALAIVSCAVEVDTESAATVAATPRSAVATTSIPSASHPTPIASPTVTATTQVRVTTTAVSRNATTSTLPEPTTTTHAPVPALAAGLFCRDLAAAGYPYADAVAYWELEGRPRRMDADRNGIPCETVYSPKDALAYWGDPLPVSTTTPAAGYALELTAEQAPLPSSSGTYGSGCAPGSGSLPDGIWFGWIIDIRINEIVFDLGCLWPSPDAPGPTNTSTRQRVVAVDLDAVVYPLDDEGGGWVPVGYATWSGPVGWCPPGSMSPSFPDGCLWWLAVNDGAVTEMLEFWVA